MADLRKFGATSQKVRFTLKNKTTGQGITGVSSSTTGLVVSTITDVDSSAVAYSGANLQTIATIGTYAAPSAGKCRLGEVDSTNHKGLYEFQFLDARFAVTNATRLVISVNDAEATILDADYEIQLLQQDPYATNWNASVAAYANGQDPFTLVMKADWTGVTGEASHSALNALRFVRNKWTIVSTTLTVFKEDGSTTAWTGARTVTAGANPITGLA